MVLHGSTVATNAVLERKLAPVGLLTTAFGYLTAAAAAPAAPFLLVAAAVAAVVEIVGRLLGFESPLGSLFGALAAGAVWAAGKLREVLGGTLGWLVGQVREFLKWLGLAGAGTADVAGVAAAAAETAPPGLSPGQRAAAANTSAGLAGAAARSDVGGGSLVGLAAAFAPLVAATERAAEAAETTAQHAASIDDRLRRGTLLVGA